MGLVLRGRDRSGEVGSLELRPRFSAIRGSVGKDVPVRATITRPNRALVYLIGLFRLEVGSFVVS